MRVLVKQRRIVSLPASWPPSDAASGNGLEDAVERLARQEDLAKRGCRRGRVQESGSLRIHQRLGPPAPRHETDVRPQLLLRARRGMPRGRVGEVQAESARNQPGATGHPPVFGRSLEPTTPAAQLIG